MQLPPSPGAYGPQALARDLQRLLELPAGTKAELSVWYDEAHAVQERIRASEELQAIPHSLWHFFSDADVRAREPSIREQQFEQVRRHIDVMATGAMLPDDSQAVSLGTLAGGLWSVIRGKKG